MPFNPLSRPALASPPKPPASPMQAIPSVLGRYDAMAGSVQLPRKTLGSTGCKGLSPGDPDASGSAHLLPRRGSRLRQRRKVEPPHHAFQGPDGVFRWRQERGDGELPDVHDARE